MSGPGQTTSQNGETTPERRAAAQQGLEEFGRDEITLFFTALGVSTAVFFAFESWSLFVRLVASLVSLPFVIWIMARGAPRMRGFVTWLVQPHQWADGWAELKKAWQRRTHHNAVKYFVTVGGMVLLIPALVVPIRKILNDIVVRARACPTSQSLADGAADKIESRPDLAVLEFLEATRFCETEDARVGLLAALSRLAIVDRYLPSIEAKTPPVVAADAAGSVVAVGSEDGTVRVWRTDSWSGSDLAPSHSAKVSAAVLTPDGALLVTADTQGVVRLWSVREQRLLRKLDVEHLGSVEAIAVSRDGSQVATGGDDGVAVWALPSGDWMRGPTIPGGTKSKVRSLAFDNSGERLAVGNIEGTTILVPARNPATRLEIFEGFVGPVAGITFMPGDDDTILAADTAGQIKSWDTVTGNSQLVGHHSSLTHFAVSPDEDLVASAGDDGVVRIWSFAARALALVEEIPHAGPVTRLSFAGPDRIAGVTSNGIQVSRIGGRRGLASELPVERDEPIWAAAMSGDGSIAVAGGVRGQLHVWNTASQTALPVHGNDHAAATIRSLSISPGSRQLASGDNAGRIIVWSLDAASGASATRVFVTDSSVRGIAWAGDDRVASGHADGLVRIWDIGASDEAPERVMEHGAAIWSVAVGDGADVVASGGDDGVIRVWDIDDGKLRGELEAHGGAVRALAFHPAEADALASAGDDSVLAMWSIEGLALVCDAGTREPGYAMAFTPEGVTLVSAHGNSLWVSDGELDGACLQPIGEELVGHGNTVRGLAMDPEGLTLLSVDFNGGALLWNLDPRILRDQACTLVGRNMSLDEWNGLEKRNKDDPKHYVRHCPDFPPGPGADVVAPAADYGDEE